MTEEQGFSTSSPFKDALNLVSPSNTELETYGLKYVLNALAATVDRCLAQYRHNIDIKTIIKICNKNM